MKAISKKTTTAPDARIPKTRQPNRSIYGDEEAGAVLRWLILLRIICNSLAAEPQLSIARDCLTHFVSVPLGYADKRLGRRSRGIDDELKDHKIASFGTPLTWMAQVTKMVLGEMCVSSQSTLPIPRSVPLLRSSTGGVTKGNRIAADPPDYPMPQHPPFFGLNASWIQLLDPFDFVATERGVGLGSVHTLKDTLNGWDNRSTIIAVALGRDATRTI